MTTADQLREIVRYLQQRIESSPDGGRAVVFNQPEVDEMIAAGLDPDASRTILEAPWWPELVDDVIETPDFADPGDSADVVLGYARDVVQEYAWKRFELGE